MTRRNRLLLILGLFVLTFAAYWPALHGDFIWDDDRHVSNNRTLRDADGLLHIWTEPGDLPQWYPLTHTTFWVERHVYGLNTLGYHIDNVLLHVCNALLLYVLLTLLDIPGAMLAAVIFALHPIEVESVAWISERKNLLSTFFAFLSIIIFWRSTTRQSYLVALALFVAAMLSKTVACFVPPVLLILIAWKRGRPRKSDWLRLLPYFVIGLVMAVFTAWTEANHVGARGPEWNISPWVRCMIAGRAICFYAATLLVPVHLTFSYPRWPIDGNHWQWVFSAAVITSLIALWRLRFRWGAGPLVAASIFVIVLFPALGFINTYPMRYSFVADHFQYVAGCALIALISAVLSQWFSQRWLVAPFGVVLALLTFSQAHIYANQETLWRDTIAKNPASWLAHENLAVWLALHDRPAESLPLFARVAVMKSNHEKVHGNWGDALMKLDRWDEAIAQYRLALGSPVADQFLTHMHIGSALQNLHRDDDARREFELALQFDSDGASARMALAEILARDGHFDAAIAEADRILQKNPRSLEMLRESASWLLKLDRAGDAETRLLQATEIEPADVPTRMMLGQIELRLDQRTQAARDFSAVLNIDPKNADAQQGLKRSLTIGSTTSP